MDEDPDASEPLGRLRASLADVRDRSVANWQPALAIAAVGVWLVSLARHLTRAEDTVVGADPALYQHVGWYVTQGAAPYVHAFDVKPPLVFETTTVFAYLSGGNPYVLHGLSVIATGVMFTAIVVLVGKHTHRITGSARGALAAGLFLLAFAPFHVFPVDGLRPKYYALAAGLASLWLILEERPVLAGVAGAVSAAFWHVCIVFPVLALADTARSRSLRDAGLLTLGGIATAVVVLTPMVAWGAFEAMVTETLLAPTMTGEGGDVFFRGAKGILHLSWTLPLALVAAVGLVRTLVDRPGPRHWLGLAALLAATQLVFLDYDGSPDLFLGFVVLAIGFGAYLAAASPSRRKALGGLLGATLFVSVVGSGGFGVVFAPAWETGEQMREDPALVHRGLQEMKTWIREGDGTNSSGAPTYPEIDSPYGRERIYEIYWEQIEPTSCHYRLADVELWWLEITGRPVMAETCGDWPDGAWGIDW